ncbi:MAG: sigma-54 dependent transcriptional regulator [Candidatus Goldiibacteriota bacterium]|jgi:DNA-binding NtrC family response regulator
MTINKRRILVIDDNKSTLKVINAILTQDNYAVFTASEAAEALDVVGKENMDLILLDLKMPGMDGLELYKKIREIDRDVSVIIMTAYGTVESAVQAMKIGIDNYLQKPLNFDELKLTIFKIFEKVEMKEDLALLKGELKGENIFENMIGKSKKMREIFGKITSIAKTDSTVLITGESGTGKEMAARAIHNLSKRRDNKMIVINLAAVPEGLQESEMFGYEKGAFTGAYNARQGKFELSDKGTIFLDEIGNINYRVQAKLLRVLEERKVEPLGSNKSKPIDVRIISATNTELKNEAANGRFREDLYYRLNVISLHMPSLRERKADIPLLSGHFLKEVCLKNSMNEKSLSEGALERLMEYNWPGNIRELRNVIEEAVVISSTDVIEPDMLNLSYERFADSAADSTSAQGDATLSEVEKKSIINALIKTKGNQTKAARLLGVTRKIIMNKIDKYQISEIVPVRTRIAKKPL